MADSLRTKIRIPGFKLHEVLGRGAMSVVFRATQTATDEEKAIKLLRGEHLSRKDLRQRFQREARLAASINHPSILKVEYFGEYNKLPYMVMPLLDPVTLGDRIERKGPLSIQEAISTTCHVLDALEELHNHNVVHRDLKAENILYTKDGIPILTDLGLAFEENDTRITSIGTGPLGTPQYMAPEQWMGEAGDRKTDIFACGVLLYYLLTGDFPFHAESRKSMVKMLMSGHPKELPASIHPEDIRLAIEAVIHKAVSIEPHDRYQHAKEMNSALQNIELGAASDSFHQIAPVDESSIDDDFSEKELTFDTNPGMTAGSSPGHAGHKLTPLPEDPEADTRRKKRTTFPNINKNQDNRISQHPEPIEEENSDIQIIQSFSQHSSPPQKVETEKPKKESRAKQNQNLTRNPPVKFPVSNEIEQLEAKIIKLTAPTETDSTPHSTKPQNGIEKMTQLNDEKNPQKLAINPVEIAPGSFWVGKRTPGDFFYANPYLRCFKGNNEEFNLIIDPGSSSDFAIVQAKSSRIIGNLSKINAAFINHQDPDVGSSVGPLIGRYSPQAYCLCTEDTWRLVHYYNIPRERFVPLEKYPNGFRLPTGHKLIPVPSPFCHFVGAMMIYDPETEVLFSGDLFGGLTDKNAKGLWADETDWVGMRAFHQIYMPTRGALSNAIANIRAIKGEVKIIAPQHGRLLTGDIMHKFMERLDNLSVGLDILSDRQATPDELLAWSTVLQRLLKRASDFTTEDLYKIILENKSLDGLIVETDSGIEIRKMGKYTIEQVLRTICQTVKDKDIEGMIKYEAVYATGELGLPTPNMDIDEGEVPHSRGSMLGSIVD